MAVAGGHVAKRHEIGADDDWRPDRRVVGVAVVGKPVAKLTQAGPVPISRLWAFALGFQVDGVGVDQRGQHNGLPEKGKPVNESTALSHSTGAGPRFRAAKIWLGTVSFYPKGMPGGN